MARFVVFFAVCAFLIASCEQYEFGVIPAVQNTSHQFFRTSDTLSHSTSFMNSTDLKNLMMVNRRCNLHAHHEYWNNQLKKYDAVIMDHLQTVLNESASAVTMEVLYAFRSYFLCDFEWEKTDKMKEIQNFVRKMPKCFSNFCFKQMDPLYFPANNESILQSGIPGAEEAVRLINVGRLLLIAERKAVVDFFGHTLDELNVYPAIIDSGGIIRLFKYRFSASMAGIIMRLDSFYRLSSVMKYETWGRIWGWKQLFHFGLHSALFPVFKLFRDTMIRPSIITNSREMNIMENEIINPPQRVSKLATKAMFFLLDEKKKNLFMLLNKKLKTNLDAIQIWFKDVENLWEICIKPYISPKSVPNEQKLKY